MSGRAVGVAWLRREDYQRIREISDDEMVPTFDEFEAKMTGQLSNLEAEGMVCKKVIIDPDELLACQNLHARRQLSANAAIAGSRVALQMPAN
jgi:hypothetical protein